MTLPLTPEVADAVRRTAEHVDRWLTDGQHTSTWLAQQVLDAVLADPVLTRHADGHVTVAWPEHAVAAIVSRDALDAFVEQHNVDATRTVAVRLVSGPGDRPQRLEPVWPDNAGARALIDRHLLDDLVADANALRTLRRILQGAQR